MSDLVRCVFYYGSGTVRINELGADLSEFRCSEVELNAPQTWALSQCQNWLTSSLGLDYERYTVGVHALWTKSRSNIYWYMRPIDNDEKWLRWLQACERRGENPVALVLTVPKNIVIPPEGQSSEETYVGGGGYESGQSSHAHDEGGGYESGQSSLTAGAGGYSGEVDSDERGEHMQKQMEEEDSAGESGDSNGSESSDESDEEENDEEMPIPIS